MRKQERLAKHMEDQQLAAAAAAASSSATSVYCSTVEELQPSVAVTTERVSGARFEEPSSAQVFTSSQQYWTSIDYLTEEEDDDSFVRECPGRQIRKIKREHIKLLKKIQEGSQGAIYTAQVYDFDGELSEEDKTPSECIAKVFKRRHWCQWPEEAFGLHLSNMYICQFHGYCLDGDCFILVMLKYDCSLREVLDRRMRNWKKILLGRPLPDFFVVATIIRIALGMQFLHERDILHRDLKADNIFVLLNRDGFPTIPCIGDFDVASCVIGTRFWRAPEVLQALKERKRPIFTRQADVYSFAMTCYEILTGAIPFENAQQYNYDVVLSGKRPKLPSNLNPKMKDLLNRCWHQIPSMRPTFHEIVDELRGLHRELLTGSEFLSEFIMDEMFDKSTSLVDRVGTNSQSCMVELKELLQTLVVKYKQADFLAVGCELVADMEQYHSQFGFQSLTQQQEQPPIAYSQWVPRLILSDSIHWKSELLSGILPFTPELARMRKVVQRILGARIRIPEISDESSGTNEENAARDAEFKAWLVERESRAMPAKNPHHACSEQLEKGGNNTDMFQACDVCKNAHDAGHLSVKSMKSCLYVESGAKLEKLLPSTFLSAIEGMSRFLF